MQYRKDIDGLRAVAILPVVLYHFGVPGFSGGFVGVDVFFVISGFLITGLLNEELRRGSLSILGFYERRIRRILPAFFIMIAAVSVAGYLTMLPGHLQKTAISGLAAIFFVANIYFSSQSGYFDTESTVKPLWHTWSLSVEEQFYIVLPLLMIGIARWSRTKLQPVLVVLAAVSLVASAFTAFEWPNATFYMTPLRMWELLAGSLVALREPGRPWSKRTREGVGCVALAMIIAPAMLYDASMPFPGISALPPVLGAALLLADRDAQKTLPNRLLASRVPRYFGLISYSLYLWHWPILVFAQYRAIPETLSFAVRLGLVAVSIAIATLSWWFVERPFRRPAERSPRASVFRVSAATAAALALSSLCAVVGKGLPGRLPAAAAHWDALASDYNPRRAECLGRGKRQIPLDKSCLYGDVAKKPSYAVWGDSFGCELVMAIGDRIKDRRQSVVQLTQTACPPALKFGSWTRCADYNTRVVDFLEHSKTIETVILVANYNLYSLDNNVLLSGMQATTTRLAAAGKKVAIVYPIPMLDFAAPVIAAMYAMRGEDPASYRIARSSYEQRSRHTIQRLDGLLGPRVVKIDLISALCDKISCSIVSGNQLLYFDNYHLSVMGAFHVRPMFDPVLGASTRPTAADVRR